MNAVYPCYTPPCGLGADAGATPGTPVASSTVASLLSTAEQAILRATTPGGTYIQGADGSIYYRQPDGSNVPILSTGQTLVGGKINTAGAAAFSDTSTVLIVGLGIVGVFLIVSAMRRH